MTKSKVNLAVKSFIILIVWKANTVRYPNLNLLQCDMNNEF